MYQFLARLKEILPSFQSEKKAFVITTMALFSGDGALVLRKKIRDLGFGFIWAINIALASNLGVPLFRYNPAPQDKIEKRQEKGIRKLNKLLVCMKENKKFMEGRRPFAILGGIMQRAGEKYELKVFANLSVDPALCTTCFQCIKYCPTDNISWDNGDFHFGDKCTICMRCYNYCPPQAIQVFNRTPDPKKHRQVKGPNKDFRLSMMMPDTNEIPEKNQNTDK